MFEKVRMDALNWAKPDPDLDTVRDHPRYNAMLAAAEAPGAIAMTLVRYCPAKIPAEQLVFTPA